LARFWKPDAEKRTVPTLIRWTEDEAQKVRHSASIRQMDVAEFIRRAALGRKADVDFETEIVLALSDITRAMRVMHAAMVERGIAPPEAELLPLILEARAAWRRCCACRLKTGVAPFRWTVKQLIESCGMDLPVGVPAGLLFIVLLLVAHGRAVADAAVQARGVVPALDEGKHGTLSLRAGGQALAGEQLPFECGEEALAHGVVVGIAHRAH